MKLPAMSFSKDAVVGFLLRHVEKIVVSVIGLLALLLVWNGISALRSKSAAIDRRPEAIARLAGETTQHIDAEPNPPAEALRRAGELAKTIDPWRASQVKVAAAPDVAPLSKPTIASITLRSEPQVFPIEDLRAVAGVAVIRDQAAEQAGGAPPAAPGQESTETANPDYDEPAKRFEKLVPCVVLVGLVPVAKQRAEYRRALGTPFDDASLGQPQIDTPRWGDFVVERTVVTADNQEKWTPISARGSFDQGGGKQLPERFLLGPEDLALAGGGSGYVAALPPRIDQPWGLDTIHPWFLQPRHKWRFERGEQIAETPVRLSPTEFREQFADHAGHAVEILRMKFAGAAQRTASPETVIMNVAAADGSEQFAPPDPASGTATAPTAPVFVMAANWQKTLDMKSVETCNLRVIPAIDGGAAVAQIVGITPLGENGTAGDEQRDPRGGTAAGMGGAFGPGGDGAMLGPQLIAGGPDAGADYRLFRFVDDAVEFGKAYRYRVKIELTNPNWGVDPKLLTNAKSAETELLSAESAPAAPVVIQRPYVMAVRDAIVGTVPAPANPESGKREARAPRPPSLGKTQVEVSFIGPTWLRMRGKRDPGYDYFDYGIGHVSPVRPGGSVLWKKARKPKSDQPKTETPEKPRTKDSPWRLMVSADPVRDLVDFRGRQASEGGTDGGKKDASAATSLVREPVEVVLLRPDGSLEMVTAAESQRLIDAFAPGSGGDGMPPSEPGGAPRTQSDGMGIR